MASRKRGVGACRARLLHRSALRPAHGRPSVRAGRPRLVAAGGPAAAGIDARGRPAPGRAVRRLAEQGLMRAHEVGNAVWYDIDTIADLESAVALVGEPETA